MIEHIDKGGGEIRILVADDEQGILDEYAAILAHSQAADERRSKLADLEAELFGRVEEEQPRHPEFSLCLCRQADEAVHAVEESMRDGRPFAIAFLDVRMPPGPDGVNAAERIRKLDQEINIVFVTGFSDISPEEIRTRVPPLDKLLYCQKAIPRGRVAAGRLCLVGEMGGEPQPADDPSKARAGGHLDLGHRLQLGAGTGPLAGVRQRQRGATLRLAARIVPE